ncbi:putative phage portal protein [Melissococcus plutonius]|uniref:phage portal protein n=1 Tax=Melissococcus plutonius TaxID=33970 RepID=UPI00065E6CD2|nr:phage portal protein [Melissococcus plutonius]AIM25763.1 putative phage portal protein [Melissococcus plutonius S1]KMT23450.1 putative phage portal protein [Melissococcus plutonius]KMT25208.1 putative phage portal protein [Melissococcus plutonius]KMT26114.1 putative phage portal protein [Melissococcus plutonius]KMT26844.1 putative phage portal protein [Melissococcus plutonius]
MLFRSLKKNYNTVQVGNSGIGLSMENNRLIFSGDYINARKALKHSDIFSVIHLLSSDLAAVSFETKKKQVAQILNRPNELSNRYGFWQTVFAQLLLTGNSYVRIYGNETTGKIDTLEYLSPDQVTVYEDNYNTALWYDITFPNSERKDERAISGEEILHFRICSTDGKVGNSPLVPLTPEMKLQDANQEFTQKAFNDALNIKGILEINRTDLSSEAQKVFKHQFLSTLKEDGIGIVDQLSKYHPIEVSQDLAKLLNATDWTSAQIAKAYGVPKDYLGSESEHSNIEMVSNLYTTTLARYIRPVVSELQTKLARDIDPSIRHVLDMDGQLLENRVGNLVQKSIITPAVAQEILLQSNADLLTEDILAKVEEKGYETIPSSPEKGGENNQEGNQSKDIESGDEASESGK